MKRFYHFGLVVCLAIFSGPEIVFAQTSNPTHAGFYRNASGGFSLPTTVKVSGNQAHLLSKSQNAYGVVAWPYTTVVYNVIFDGDYSGYGDANLKQPACMELSGYYVFIGGQNGLEISQHNMVLHTTRELWLWPIAS